MQGCSARVSFASPHYSSCACAAHRLFAAEVAQAHGLPGLPWYKALLMSPRHCIAVPALFRCLHPAARDCREAVPRADGSSQARCRGCTRSSSSTSCSPARQQPVWHGGSRAAGVLQHLCRRLQAAVTEPVGSSSTAQRECAGAPGGATAPSTAAAAADVQRVHTRQPTSPAAPACQPYQQHHQQQQHRHRAAPRPGWAAAATAAACT